MPKRIQRKRIKGWRLPENAVSITRPGKFGNPFKKGQWFKRGFRGMTYARCLSDEPRHREGFTLIETDEEAIEWFRWYVTTTNNEKKLAALKGKDLACWCKEGKPCHGDVWIELANS